MLSSPELQYLALDFQSSETRLTMLGSIRRVRPNLHVIVFGPEGNDELVLESLIAGARAYLTPTADVELMRQVIGVIGSGSIWAPTRILSKLVDRLLRVSDSSLTSGAVHLTDREKEILDQVLEARSTREMARILGIKEGTVKLHVRHLLHKMGTDNRVELAIRALNRPGSPRPRSD